MLDEVTRQQSFPSLSEMTYLNTAAEGIPPLEVGEALQAYFRDHQLGMDGREMHIVQRQAVQALTAQLYGLNADEIGICSCSSEAYNLAGMALHLRDGDEVIISDLDFPAGTTPWLQPTSPATVKVWQARDGALHVEDLIPLLSPRTRLLQVSLVSFFNGFKVALQQVIAAVRQKSDALISVDVTQALGRVPLDMTDVDLIISSTHKWILALHGGCLVGVPSSRSGDWTVPAGGWFNLHDPFGPHQYERAQSLKGAASFSVGMPNYPAIYGIRAALEYILDVGVEAIANATDDLVRACYAGIKKLPVELLTPDAPDMMAGIIAFRHPQAERIHQQLLNDNIHIMAHAGRLRVAIHGYNRIEDIEHLLEKLHTAVKQVG